MQETLEHTGDAAEEETPHQRYLHGRALEDVERLARAAALYFPRPEDAERGLRELLVNAIEHGNLGIGYEEKNDLVRRGVWSQEIARRLASPPMKDRRVFLTVACSRRRVLARVADQGQGFDWRPYLDFAPERALRPHGRGIAIARASFASLRYNDAGNEAICEDFFSGGSGAFAG